MKDSEPSLNKPRQKTVAILIAVIALVIVGWALRATSVVAMPLAVAACIAVLLRPVDVAVRRRVPRRLRWLGVLAAMLVFVAVLGVVFVAVFLSAKAIAEAAPKYEEQLSSYWQSAQASAADHGMELNAELLTSDQTTGQIVSWVTGGLVSVWSILGAKVLVFFLVILLLIEADNWRRKIEKSAPPDAEFNILATADTAALKLRHYMWTTTLISAASAITEGLYLWLMGVAFAFVWSFLIFLANYVPNIGSIVTLSGATLTAFMLLGWQWGLTVGLGLTVIDQTIGNFIAPRIQGRQLSLSPVVILISTLLWGWLWGVIGAVLATPIMLLILIFCAHTDSMRWLAVLLSDDGDVSRFMCDDSGTCPSPKS